MFSNTRNLLRCSSNKLSNLRLLSTAKKPFDKILIANRGEIACRVMKTAKKMGIKTVAVYSDADASGMHVRMADESFNIGGPLSADSYLKMDTIIDIAKKTGAQAIHPGYGFLSENSKFVEKVEEAGIAFMGPPGAPMLSMGDKINSKKIASDAGCFIIPGFAGEVASEEDASRICKDIGFPVMIKASAGGGGKGMRVAYNDKEVREGFRLSKAEALSSFGDDRMLIERFIEDPHHIEIQVIADGHGNVVAFPERECSVQRRNQKVVEEAPSMLLTPETRRLMQEQAIMLCKATNYRSAGTVEMLCDGKQNFYFLEMNTRLQVEHPITELVTGEDIVEHMINIAAGEKLPERFINNPFIPINGWAIESRVYAEDPLRNFLPSIGPLITYQEPPLSTSPNSTVRLDTGVYEGGVISKYYDPMIAKLCTHAATRNEAITLMESALDNYVVSGLGNNLSFLSSVMQNEIFRSGDYNTKFIEEQYADGFKGVELNEEQSLELITVATAMHQERVNLSLSPELRSNGYDSMEEDYIVILKDQQGKEHAYNVELSLEDSLVAEISAISATGKVLHEPKRVVVECLDWQIESRIAYVGFQNSEKKHDDHSGDKVFQYEGRSNEGYRLRYRGSQQEVIVRSQLEHELSKHMLAPEVKDVSKFLLCPMPGTLISCDVVAGQSVEQGQQLAVVEAMKMQNILYAEKAGVVKDIKCAAGSNLKVDQVILEFASSEEK
jgi:propionyl-CoA carboxylase alpha chain